jgi:ABC-type uncharacterized transport system substrate-binding protein
MARAYRLQQSDLTGRQLELLREVVPALRRLAILAKAGNPITLREMRDVEAAAGTPGLTVVTVEIRRMEDNALKPRATQGRPRHRLKEKARGV